MEKETQSLLEKIEQSATNLIKYGKIYNEEEKARMFAIIPYAEEQAANKAVDLAYEAEITKEKLNEIKNKLMLEAIELKDTLGLTNQASQTSWVESHSEWKQARRKYLELKREQGHQENQARRLDKQFATINKLITKDINSDFLTNSGQRKIS